MQYLQSFNAPTLFAYRALKNKDEYSCSLIFEYFSNLNLVPLKERSKLINYEHNIYFSSMFTFSNNEKLFINEIYLDDLTIFHLSSDRNNFPNGYYQIIDSKFDYRYIEKLIK